MTEDQNKALALCIEYDRLPREIEWLTKEIGELVCPKQTPRDAFDDMDSAPESLRYESDSCFQKARNDKANWRKSPWPYDPPSPPLLQDVERAVADCHACSHLCGLIRERKEVRKRWGVVKRQIRALGRKYRETPHD